MNYLNSHFHSKLHFLVPEILLYFSVYSQKKKLQIRQHLDAPAIKSIQGGTSQPQTKLRNFTFEKLIPWNFRYSWTRTVLETANLQNHACAFNDGLMLRIIVFICRLTPIVF